MNEKDYRRQIGEKLKEAYLSQPIGETPSKETFDKWIGIAEEKRAERRRRRKELAICVVALVICVALGVACIFAPPQVEAGGKGGSTIEQNLETSGVEAKLRTIRTMKVLIIANRNRGNNQFIMKTGKYYKLNKIGYSIKS